MKNKIIIRATELFLSLGFKSVTMDDLAQSMGISKKTIYQFFKNKDQLIRSCTRSIQTKLVEEFNEIRKNAGNPIIELFQVKKEVMKILGNTETAPQFQLQKFYPEIYKELKDREFELVGKNLQESLERGINSGYFRKEINIDFNNIVTLLYFDL